MKVIRADSVVGRPPSLTTMVGAMAGAEGVATRLLTLVLAVVLVKVSVSPEAAPVAQAAELPLVKEPPLRSPKVLVAVRLLMT